MSPSNQRLMAWSLSYVFVGFFALIAITCFLPLIEKWQTLISGLLAVGAAGLTVYYLRAQIEQEKNHEQQRLDRRFTAARAIMPLALSNICDYSEKIIESLKTIFTQFTEDGVRPLDENGDPLNIMYSPPETPENLIRDLEKIIEATPDKEVANRLADALGEMQIINSRLHSLSKNLKNRHHIVFQRNIINHVLKAIAIHAMASSLFRYSRRASIVADQFNIDMLKQSVHLTVPDEPIFSNLWKYLSEFSDDDFRLSYS